MANHITIVPGPDSLTDYLAKVWHKRSLVITFARRDLKVKYAQTFLGIAWTLLQPIVTVSIFTFFFGYILKWKTGDIPFALYVYSGLLGWNFFSYIVFQGTSSTFESSAVIRKIYFPKLLLPLSKVLVALVELSISFVVFIMLMIVFGMYPSWRIIFLPFLVILNIIPALTLVIFTSAFSFKHRDLMHLVPFMMYVGIWITPVFFTFKTLPESLQWLWLINPLTGIMEGWRWCLFESWIFKTEYIIAPLCTLLLFIIGILIYIKKEFSFSDYI